MDTINRVSDVREFFYRQIRDAIENQCIDATPEAECYLVHLLSRFAKSERLYQELNNRVEEDALFKLLERAMEADRESRIILLRRLGDIALYFAGYFPESLTRKLVDLDYYIQMGGTAYGSISSLVTRPPEQDLYQELSLKFKHWVQILSEVSTHTQIHSEQDLLRLYESWLETGNQVAHRLLHKKGIIPHGGNEENH